MKKIFKSLFSMQSMIILLFFMAVSCAMATFVENDFGPLGAKSFVYGQRWFETIMFLLTIGVVFNIIWFKMYKKDKFFVFFIHISFIFILLGAGLTRYLGYEAYMTIPEGSLQNKMLSNDEYIQIKNNEKIIFEKKVLMTPLSQSSVNFNTKINNEELTVEFNRFVENAVEKIVPSEDGKSLINILLTTPKGTRSIDLEDQNSIETDFLTFSLNKEIKSSKPTIYFETKNNQLYIKSNIKSNVYTKDLKKFKTIEADTSTTLLLEKIYRIGQTQFMINEATSKGVLKTVSTSNNLPKEKRLNAVVLNLTYKNHTREVSLFGKGGATKGYQRIITLDDKNLSLSWGAKELELPFSILLNDFRLTRYPGSNSPSTYESDLKIYDKVDKNSFEYTIFMNNVLDYKGYRFFQSSYKQDESATILSVNKDPGKTPTYIGYFLLFTGLILSLFMKKSRFSKLARKKYTLEDIKKTYYSKKVIYSFFIVLIAINTPNQSFANEQLLKNNPEVLNINKEHAKNFGSLLVQDYQGRIKPINSLAIEIINKISRKNELYSLDANQFFLSMMLYPEIWQKIKFIKIKDKKLKKLIGIDENRNTISFSDIYNQQGNYKLQIALEEANTKKPILRTNFDKDLIKIDERLNIAYTLFTGDFLRVFPKKDDYNNKWLNINEAIKLLIAKDSNKIKELMEIYYFSLNDATQNKLDWEKVDEALENIKKYQKSYASSIMPNSFKIKAELLFNKYNIFERLTPFYLIVGVFMLILVFINIFKSNVNLKKITKIVLVLLIIAFIVHTIGLALRWYISGHAPWSNGYESMIYIAWAIILSGIFFSKHSYLALASTTILSGVTLFVAHLSWMEPQITTLTPVLKSYWLTIHVSVITASYGFLGLSALLGFICLCLFILANPKKEDDNFFNILLSIKESNRISEMSILIGLVLLVIGNFLGGIWANESWGRYWGWDPKETWTLISIIIYAIIIHLKYIKNIMTEFNFAVLSTLSYSSIIMTYFGVNYYLAGKHSYAAGDPIPIPTFIPVTLFIIFVVILFAYRNRKTI
ncbi:cytochrome c biogenesis protein CcsA [Arcobacter sp. YIC-464]|uniref:cytochrome c biogenesis protein n=1 Tax=Arcobacter sp. YIC-464 TaxID=3376631 RepID=UPI003C1C32BB